MCKFAPAADVTAQSRYDDSIPFARRGIPSADLVEEAMNVLGIDIGGSGIKGAPVDTNTGDLLQERHRIPTPQPSAPRAVAEVVKQMAAHFDWDGPIGCTFPGVVMHGVVYSAANVDKRWIETPGADLFSEYTGCPVHLINDADAAGMAEMKLGAGRGLAGVVLMLTFGTGIGSALFTEGVLVPNTELGHLEVAGKEAEHRAAARIRKDKALSWKGWGRRVNKVLGEFEALFSPDVFIIGGGVSKQYDKFLPHIETRAKVVPAEMLNDAGIVGAAMSAQHQLGPQLGA